MRVAAVLTLCGLTILAHPTASRAGGTNLSLVISRHNNKNAMESTDGRSSIPVAALPIRFHIHLDTGVICGSASLELKNTTVGRIVKRAAKCAGDSCTAVADSLEKGTWQLTMKCGNDAVENGLEIISPGLAVKDEGGKDEVKGNDKPEDAAWQKIANWIDSPGVVERANEERSQVVKDQQYAIDQRRAHRREKPRPASNYLTPDNVFVVTALGTVALAPEGVIDEDDLIEFRIVAHKQLLPMLRVRRASKTRVDEFNVIGADVRLREFKQLELHAKGDDSTGVMRVELRDFAPGEASVEIAAQIGSTSLTLGTVNFKVNRLYHGILSFGPVLTNRTTPGFTLIRAGNQTVVSREASPHDYDLRYAFFYTPFLWYPWEPERAWNDAWWKFHIGPMAGVDVDDLRKHAYVGLSFVRQTFLVHLGAHLSRGVELDPRSGLVLGSPDSGAVQSIPTVKKLQSGFFVSGSLDLRAAFKLLSAAFSGVTGGGSSEPAKPAEDKSKDTTKDVPAPIGYAPTSPGAR